jgi:hypothetical protein
MQIIENTFPQGLKPNGSSGIAAGAAEAVPLQSGQFSALER